MRDWVRNLFSPRVGERLAGTPPSATGASSFFLWWDLAYGEKLTEIAVTLEVVLRPEVDRLVTFAIQSAFLRPGGGSCQLGLQHHPEYAGRSAVNWDGYTARGKRLESDRQSPLLDDEPATKGFTWLKGVPYRLTIERGDERADGTYPWIGSVTDMQSGQRDEIQRLYSKSPYIRGPVMYIESFGPCDGPRVEARWSNATAVSVAGGVRTVRSMRVDYQPHAAGGCTNTNSSVEDGTFVQRAGQMRTVKAGSTIRLN